MQRYNRNIVMIGKKGQERLRNSKVAIFGLGGLGNFVSAELALAGIGKMLLVDKDKVEVENLNRQFLFTEKDVGRPKVEVAKERLKELNPEVYVETFYGDLRNLGRDFLKGYELFIDCLDNWESRKILFEFAEKLNKPVVHGAVEGWRGQVGFLTRFEKFKRFRGKARTGVLCPAVGVIGSIQSLIAIDYLLGKIKRDFIIFVDLKGFYFIKADV